ncbi:MAG: hypothetical protein KIT25_04050 [Enhydrobacter sp.]|nr:MAG: hypothetical protein KIT25_04050 [Enhydrobacter sp.]
MTDIANLAERQMIRERRRSYHSFEYLVLFATLHVTLTIASIALAFVGDARILALLLWVGGSVAMIAAFVFRWSRSTHDGE